MSMMRMLRVVILLAFMMTSAIVITNHAASPAEAAGAAIVNVAFDEASVTADVAPGKDGIVRLSGTVTCTVPFGTNIQSIQISLVPSCPWPASISPSSITYTNQDMGRPKSFEVAVIAPPQESRKSSVQISIGGEWRQIPGATGGSIMAQAQATIAVQQFYKFSVACNNPFQEVSPGTALTYSLRINNEGNDRDTFRLQIEDIPEGWSVQLGQTSVDIEEKKSQTVTITVTPPQEWNVWKNQVTSIKVLVTSATAQTSARLVLQEPYYIFMRERGFSTPGFEPVVAAMALLAALFLAGMVRPKRER